MDSIPILIASSVALAVLGGGWLLYGYLTVTLNRIRRQRQFSRLENLLSMGVGTNAAGGQTSPQTGTSVTARLIGMLKGLLPSEPEGGQLSEERTLLIQAGFRSFQTLLAFQTLRLALPILGGVLFFAYTALSGGSGSMTRFLATITALYLGPKFVLSRLARARRLRMAEEVPLFVDYLRMMLSVGINLEKALTMFADDDRIGLPALAQEMQLVSLVIRTGRSRTEALQQMAEQMDVAELKELVSMISQADRYGAGIQEPLKALSQRLTEKKRFEMQEYIGKISTKMVVVMVLFLLPALLILTAGPGFIAIGRALREMS